MLKEVGKSVGDDECDETDDGVTGVVFEEMEEALEGGDGGGGEVHFGEGEVEVAGFDEGLDFLTQWKGGEWGVLG